MRQTTEAGFAGYPSPRAELFVPLVRPMMRCIMAGMDQEYSYVGVAWWQLLQRQLSMVPPCRKTMEISQLQYTVIDVPVELVMQVHFLVVAQRPFSHGLACLADHRDFAVAVRAGWSMFLLSF